MKRPIIRWAAICSGTLLSLVAVLLMGAISPLEQTEHATLRIYKKGYTRSGFGIEINGQKVVKRLRNRSWLDVEVPEGSLTIKTTPEFRYPTNSGKSFSLEVEAGKVYYLEAVVDYEFWAHTLYLVLREKERAEAEIKRFKQREYVIKKVE